MNPFRLLVLLVSLPLLLGGCGREESVVEIKPIESVAETKTVEEKQEKAKEEVKTEEYIALPSNHSIGFPFDVILYITGNVGIGVIVGTVLGLFIGFKRNKIKDTMKICILICGGIAMVPSLLIGFFITLLASGIGYVSSSNDEILRLAITSLLGAIPIYFLWFRKT